MPFPVVPGSSLYSAINRPVRTLSDRRDIGTHLLHTRGGALRPTPIAAAIHPTVREELGMAGSRAPVPEKRVNPETSFGSSKEASARIKWAVRAHRRTDNQNAEFGA